MKYKVTLSDGIELLVVADKEVDAVRKAREIKDSIKGGLSTNQVKDYGSTNLEYVGHLMIQIDSALDKGNFREAYNLSVKLSNELKKSI